MNDKKQPRILMLGGSTSQVIAIKKAKDMGLYVIICDYLPDNPGQYVADEFYQISTTDKEAVYELAQNLNLQGIVCYASDPAAPTAAYVCEKLNLPTSPYESVKILSNKDMFRQYLAQHGFNTPKAEWYTEYTFLEKKLDTFNYPVMVKPVDSSGSKGINKVLKKEQMKAAYDDAMKYSRCGRIIVEEYIEKKGYQISGDGFSVAGELRFRCFGNEFYGNSEIKEYVPLGECWPSVLPKEIQDKIHNELQRLITSLGMKTNAYNIEVILDKNDNVYIMELGARNGGSLIPQITEYATGVDLVEYTIKAALGESCDDLQMAEPKGFWSNYMVHSTKTGKLKEIILSDEIKENYYEYSTDFEKGDQVYKFENSGHALGEMIFKFSSMEEMLYRVQHLSEWVKVVVE